MLFLDLKKYCRDMNKLLIKLIVLCSGCLCFSVQAKLELHNCHDQSENFALLLGVSNYENLATLTSVGPGINKFKQHFVAANKSKTDQDLSMSKYCLYVYHNPKSTVGPTMYRNEVLKPFAEAIKKQKQAGKVNKVLVYLGGYIHETGTDLKLLTHGNRLDSDDEGMISLVKDVFPIVSKGELFSIVLIDGYRQQYRDALNSNRRFKKATDEVRNALLDHSSAKDANNVVVFFPFQQTSHNHPRIENNEQLESPYSSQLHNLFNQPNNFLYAAETAKVAGRAQNISREQIPHDLAANRRECRRDPENCQRFSYIYRYSKDGDTANLGVGPSQKMTLEEVLILKNEEAALSEPLWAYLFYVDNNHSDDAANVLKPFLAQNNAFAEALAGLQSGQFSGRPFATGIERCMDNLVAGKDFFHFIGELTDWDQLRSWQKEEVLNNLPKEVLRQFIRRTDFAKLNISGADYFNKWMKLLNETSLIGNDAIEFNGNANFALGFSLCQLFYSEKHKRYMGTVAFNADFTQDLTATLEGAVDTQDKAKAISKEISDKLGEVMQLQASARGCDKLSETSNQDNKTIFNTDMERQCIQGQLQPYMDSPSVDGSLLREVMGFAYFNFATGDWQLSRAHRNSLNMQVVKEIERIAGQQPKVVIDVLVIGSSSTMPYPPKGDGTPFRERLFLPAGILDRYSPYCDKQSDEASLSITETQIKVSGYDKVQFINNNCALSYARAYNGAKFLQKGLAALNRQQVRIRFVGKGAQSNGIEAQNIKVEFKVNNSNRGQKQ